MKRLWPALQQLLQRLKLRLRLSVRRRLALDVMALTTGLRPVVMLDYITYSTSTMQQLCQLLLHLSQEVENVRALRVLDMEGCGYLVHPAYLVGFMERSLISSSEPVFVVLDDSSPRKASAAEQGTIMKNLSGVRQRLSSLLVAQETEPCFNPNTKDSSGANHQRVVSEDAVGPGLLVAGNITCDSGILLPTLNGWLLGYPVVYVFTESRASWAGQCVGSDTLHLYRILVNSPLLPTLTSQGSGGPMHDEDDLLSFTVPCSLSLLGSAEVWVKVFFELIARCTEQSPEVWMSARLEVTERRMESIAF